MYLVVPRFRRAGAGFERLFFGSSARHQRRRRYRRQTLSFPRPTPDHLHMYEQLVLLAISEDGRIRDSVALRTAVGGAILSALIRWRRVRDHPRSHLVLPWPGTAKAARLPEPAQSVFEEIARSRATRPAVAWIRQIAERTELIDAVLASLCQRNVLWIDFRFIDQATCWTRLRSIAANIRLLPGNTSNEILYVNGPGGLLDECLGDFYDLVDSERGGLKDHKREFALFCNLSGVAHDLLPSDKAKRFTKQSEKDLNNDYNHDNYPMFRASMAVRNRYLYRRISFTSWDIPGLLRECELSSISLIADALQNIS